MNNIKVISTLAKQSAIVTNLVACTSNQNSIFNKLNFVNSSSSKKAT